MAKKNKTKEFLKTPEYSGGKKAMQEFINSNLQYPPDALEQKIEGVVTVEYEVNDNGIIEYSKIIKGLSPSCNEEALRVINLLQYSKAFNHGIRVKSKKKINIYFRLSQKNLDNTLQISYSFTESNVKEKDAENQKENRNYSYTINI